MPTKPIKEEITVAYIPFADVMNAYIARMIGILKSEYEVVQFPSFSVRLKNLAKLKLNRVDFLVVNWIESGIIKKSGAISYSGIAKLFLKTALYRIWAKNLVFVRHNLYPHHAGPQAAPVAKRVLDVFESLFDKVITHSGAEVQAGRQYCPHPLYLRKISDAEPIPERLQWDDGYFVVFGLMEPYKKISELIDAFPTNKRLLVIGRPGKPSYVELLQSKQRANVRVIPEMLSDGVAQAVIRKSSGLILSHADGDMVVSGSFFYAMSTTVPVYAVSTPFLASVAPGVGPDLLRVAPDLPALCAHIATAAECAQGGGIPEQVESMFGEAAVLRHMREILR